MLCHKRCGIGVFLSCSNLEIGDVSRFKVQRFCIVVGQSRWRTLGLRHKEKWVRAGPARRNHWATPDRDGTDQLLRAPRSVYLGASRRKQKPKKHQQHHLAFRIPQPPSLPFLSQPPSTRTTRSFLFPHRLSTFPCMRSRTSARRASSPASTLRAEIFSFSSSFRFFESAAVSVGSTRL